MRSAPESNRTYASPAQCAVAPGHPWATSASVCQQAPVLHAQAGVKKCRHIPALSPIAPATYRVRRLAFWVDDLDWETQLSLSPCQRLILRSHGNADATIHGPLNSFILPAAQREDPDALFFERRLVIEGDTDFGLQVKNWLDAIDPEQMPPEMVFPLGCAGEYVTLFADGDR